MRIRHYLPLLLAALSLSFAGCDSASPVAPTGTVLTLSANPTEIPLTGKTQITVQARKENGTPLNPGTEIRLSATLGKLALEVVETDDAGVARTELAGDGRIGTAEVIARSGAAESNPVMVEIGRLASAISLQATPASVPETGGRISLLALVRDDRGQPLPNVSVNFLTEVGTLASAGAFIDTNDRGEAADRLEIAELDLQSLAGDDFTVSVEASGTGGSVQTDSTTITIQRAPLADFVTSINRLTVSFQDTSTGRPNKWLWRFGENPDGGPTSEARNPSFTYSAEGTYTVELTVSNAIGSDTISRSVTVRAN